MPVITNTVPYFFFTINKPKIVPEAGSGKKDICITRNSYDKLYRVLALPFPWFCEAPLPPPPREEKSEL